MDKLIDFATNHIILVSLLAAISVMLLWNLFGSALSGIRQLSPAEVTRLINRENAVLLDVRNANEYQKGHILNSINVPDAELATRLESLEKHKNKTVITYCEFGNTSGKAARSLKTAGFEQIYSLKGGIGAWRSANLPLTKE